MWVLDHLDDLESDFSVYHRVEDIYSLDGPRFFRLAARIFAYDGVMQKHLVAEQEKQRPPTPARKGSAGGWQTVSLESVSPHLKGERREVHRG